MARSFCFLAAAAMLVGCAHPSGDVSRHLARSLGGGTQLIVIGEIHGTAEGPQLFADLVQTLAASRSPLNVGLELPGEVVAAPCDWNRPHPYWRRIRDGRTSRAMHRLFCHLKTLESSGGILLFDFADDAPPARGQPRYLAAVRRNVSNASPTLLLMGNYHARRADGSLVQALVEQGLAVLTLTMSSGRATAWTCDSSGSCAARPFNADFCPAESSRPTLIRIDDPDRRMGAWDGCIDFPSLSPSPPLSETPP